MYPDISQAIMKARVADRQHDAAVWRLAHEARLTAPQNGTRRGIVRRLSAGRAGASRTPRAAGAH
jgi:hypothetical protein